MSHFRNINGPVPTEPATVFAVAFLGSAILMAYWDLQLAVGAFVHTGKFMTFSVLRLSFPSLSSFLGLIALRRIRSIDALTGICLGGILVFVVFNVGGLFVLLTGYNFSRVNAIPVSRIRCIPWFACSIVGLAITAVAWPITQARRTREANRRFGSGNRLSNAR
jgi:hypothetical protein